MGNEMEIVSQLLKDCRNERKAKIPPTTLYNEGWMLRLVLDWFDNHRGIYHPFSFRTNSTWYSEGLLRSFFQARFRKDKRAESFTHADGIIGNIKLSTKEKGLIVPDTNVSQLVVIEAKMGSKLSSGVKNATYFDQAARNVACIAELFRNANLTPAEHSDIGFYVLAPQEQISKEIFKDLVTPESIKEKVCRRIHDYGQEGTDWYDEWFIPMIDQINLDIISWESVLGFMDMIEDNTEYSDFYYLCKQYNLSKSST
jgi:hypothetical protein